jgi:hypothetical protein
VLAVVPFEHRIPLEEAGSTAAARCRPPSIAAWHNGDKGELQLWAVSDGTDRSGYEVRAGAERYGCRSSRSWFRRSRPDPPPSGPAVALRANRRGAEPLGPVVAGIPPVNSYPERHAMQVQPRRVKGRAAPRCRSSVVTGQAVLRCRGAPSTPLRAAWPLATRHWGQGADDGQGWRLFHHRTRTRRGMRSETAAPTAKRSS